MLKGALKELRIGRTDRLAVDTGPVISAEAKANIEGHIAAMRALGRSVEQQALPEEAKQGTFVPPTIIELADIADLNREIFGPVLHVIRYRRDRLDALIDAINATGYGLTFGLHTRLDATVAHVTSRVKAGNLYVNRNVIGAVVGVQPFGGRGLSGTGPKAGGPLYMGRLVASPPPFGARAAHLDTPLSLFAEWLDGRGEDEAARMARRTGEASALGVVLELAGPVGERNIYALHPRGRILLRPATQAGLYAQMAAVLATGNHGTVEGMALPVGLPVRVAAAFLPGDGQDFAAALIEGGAARVAAMVETVAAMPGPIISVHAADPAQSVAYPLDLLLEEISTSINTTAAGGNASLMMIG
jgi:RHH-type proline utilization regulon transcriptional repressor/proline dehydrogenase/delta 1-pyrroline-5-carboxylate dehydrogenase